MKIDADRGSGEDFPATSLPSAEETSVLTPRFDEKGLITAVVTDFSSATLLMVAHMNREALDLSIRTGIAHYFSRSRGRLWKKGETSGALQKIREMRVDCDQDAVWLVVDVAVPQDTCHTHRESCFYRQVELQSGDMDSGPIALTFIDRVISLSNDVI